MAIDRFGRNLHYLRISLTDHCNLRCVYCMPEDMTFRPIAEMMQDDELFLLVRLFANLGFDKFRLTGGEPTVRAHVVDVVREIAATPGVNSLSMTTNGILLGKLARPLKEAGLQRVNVSVDTLNAERFKKLTRWGSLDKVWEGVIEAEAVGLTPIKINSVVVRGMNDCDVVDMARLTYDHPWQIRFIEMMPFAGATEFQQKQVVKAKEMQQLITASLGPLEPVHEGTLDGEARIYKLRGALGEVGFISSVSLPFCASCSRARLTADGKIRLCLLRENELDLLTPLRHGASLEDLRKLIVESIWQKPWGHGLADGEVPLNRVMSEIGG
jgi:GTP 3',8-cyclase